MRIIYYLFITMLIMSCDVAEYNGEVLPVSEVTEIQVSRLSGNPAQLQITVTGIVPTAGWTDPQLIPFQYLVPPAGGIYDFTFMAKSPDGIVAQVETPITATTNMVAEGVNGIIVHSDGEPVKYLLDDKLTDLRLIYEITGIEVKANKLIVSGNTRTLGWSNPVLVLKSHTKGLLEYDFFAKAPTGLVGQAISPIEASVDLPLGYSNITVSSETNSLNYP